MKSYNRCALWFAWAIPPHVEWFKAITLQLFKENVTDNFFWCLQIKHFSFVEFLLIKGNEQGVIGKKSVIASFVKRL